MKACKGHVSLQAIFLFAMIIPRQQIISFKVLPGQEANISSFTKYNHDKVVGVVLLPDKTTFGDRIYLEINKQTILPYNFNAGLISFRQFLNKEIKRSVYQFEEWAKGSELKIKYRNNDKRSVSIDLILFTVQGDNQPITQRKKLQIVPVNFIDRNFEPIEIRTKTDFYYQELIGVFNDHFNFIRKDFDFVIVNGSSGKIIKNFLQLLDEPGTTTEEEKKEKKGKAKKIQDAIEDLTEIPDSVKTLFESMAKCLNDYIEDITNEPEISQKDLYALQETVESFEVYQDNYQSLSTFELNVDHTPIYPENYPISNVVPRYRKTFNECMYKCSKQVQEADIYIRFTHRPYDLNPNNINTNFNVYFLYNQKAH